MNKYKSQLEAGLNKLEESDLLQLVLGSFSYDPILVILDGDKEVGYFDDECVKSAEIHYTGDGLERFSVYKFSYEDEEYFVRFYGTYESYNGTEYDGWEFVSPKEKTVVIYETDA